MKLSQVKYRIMLGLVAILIVGVVGGIYKYLTKVETDPILIGLTKSEIQERFGKPTLEGEFRMVDSEMREYRRSLLMIYPNRTNPDTRILEMRWERAFDTRVVWLGERGTSYRCIQNLRWGRLVKF